METVKSIKIKLNNVCKSYDKTKHVLEDISLAVDNKSFFSILGKSGAGKSTLMNILGLIESHDGGDYWLNGRKIFPNRDYGRIRGEYIGMIFQSYYLIPTLSSEENIKLPLLYSKEKINENHYERLICELGIKSIMGKQVNILSGGEKQRVAIARALIRNPGLIIADEPTGNLDDENKWIVYNVLRKEHEKGRGVIIITHDNELAKKVGKRFTLCEGRLHEESEDVSS